MVKIRTTLNCISSAHLIAQPYRTLLLIPFHTIVLDVGSARRRHDKGKTRLTGPSRTQGSIVC